MIISIKTDRLNMTLESFRRYFPITSTDIYLNHAAISPLSTKVTDAISAVLEKRSSGVIEIFPELKGIKETLKQNLADLVDAQADYIAIIGNTSEGFNWLVNGLEWQAGERVLLVENEFPSNIYPFLNLEQRGVIVDFVPVRQGFIYIEDIEDNIRPRTRLLSISFVEFLNGFQNQLTDIGRLCREKDILFSVDGIQGVGALPLSVQESKISFLSNGGHKWLMGPQGCGFMYVSPELFKQLKPAFVGWLSVKDSWNFFDYRLDLLDNAERFEIGTANALGMIGLNASVNLLSEAGVDSISRHLLKIGDQLIEGLSTIGLEYVGADNHKNRSGIYSFSAENTEGLFNYLKDHRIHISLRENLLRFSPHFYNTTEEIETVIHVCREFR